eukprot:TRINITY_DN235_c0_g1_i1.p1 TRINITY_DN235_c0_g1~~TRINITY_DN235_c0_g1_i1.p1  ORF type:complete len:481 (-),score=163.10 TRINITY_DN235_c0_g1_i1:54-1496(-)
MPFSFNKPSGGGSNPFAAKTPAAGGASNPFAAKTPAANNPFAKSATSTPTTNLFGKSTTATTPAANPFGAKSTATTAGTTGMFGKTTTAATNPFGAKPTTTTGATNAFGAKTVTTVAATAQKTVPVTEDTVFNKLPESTGPINKKYVADIMDMISKQESFAQSLKDFKSDSLQTLNEQLKGVETNYLTMNNLLSGQKTTLKNVKDDMHTLSQHFDQASHKLTHVNSRMPTELPSKYFLETAHSLRDQMYQLNDNIERIERTLMSEDSMSPAALIELIQQQHFAFLNVAGRVAAVNEKVEQCKQGFLRHFNLDESSNPFKQADQIEKDARRKLEEAQRIKPPVVEQPAATVTAPGAFGATSSNPFAPKTGFGTTAANPFAAKTGTAASNPFAPKTGAAASNPFAPKTGAAASNPFAPKTGAAASNPFAPKTGATASPFGAKTATTTNPFAAKTGTAASNPFAAKSGATNPFAAKTNPFAKK